MCDITEIMLLFEDKFAILVKFFEGNKQKKRYVKQAKIGDIEEIKKFVKKI